MYYSFPLGPPGYMSLPERHFSFYFKTVKGMHLDFDQALLSRCFSFCNLSLLKLEVKTIANSLVCGPASVIIKKWMPLKSLGGYHRQAGSPYLAYADDLLSKYLAHVAQC